MAERYRQEITDWDTANHTYIVEGRVLIGYIPRGKSVEYRFRAPMRNWSASNRKFRDLKKKEIEALNLERVQL